MALQVFVKQLLVLALLQHQYERERAQAFADVGETEFPTHLAAEEKAGLLGDRALLNSLLGQTDLLVNLKRTRVNAEGFGVKRDGFVFLKDDEINVVPDELTGQRESGRTCSDDDYIGSN